MLGLLAQRLWRVSSESSVVVGVGREWCKLKVKVKLPCWPNPTQAGRAGHCKCQAQASAGCSAAVAELHQNVAGSYLIRPAAAWCCGSAENLTLVCPNCTAVCVPGPGILRFSSRPSSDLRPPTSARLRLPRGALASRTQCISHGCRGPSSGLLPAVADPSAPFCAPRRRPRPRQRPPPSRTPSPASASPHQPPPMPPSKAGVMPRSSRRAPTGSSPRRQ